ncbi:MAG TPA: site-2 protease family protein [Pirellulaceae bacterium]
MNLLETPPTPFDVNFSVFGVPVRITPFFWLTAVIMGGAFANGTQLLVWVLAVLLSILIHELGHVWAYRRHGMAARIVLHQFGGVAIADGAGSVWRVPRMGRDPWRDIFIALAGPGAQILAALVVLGPIVVMATGRGMSFSSLDDLYSAVRLFLAKQPLVQLFVILFANCSIYWALLNLLPVYPLDGGQVSRNLFLIYGGHQAMTQSLWLSVIVGAAIALYFFQHGNGYGGLMFAVLAYSSYQTVQMHQGRF